MKILLQILILLFFLNKGNAQTIQNISQGIESDSSFYHITKISNNEYWVGGEYGILKRMDSVGNISAINFPNEGLRILKIEKTNNYVFIATDNAVIYRYDIAKKEFIKKTFEVLKNKCFYDLIVLSDGNLLACGGSTGISKSVKEIPNGFIASMDQDFNNFNIVWNKRFKFAWSLLETNNHEILASTYNGLTSTIIKSEDRTAWKKDTKIKGLIYALYLIDNQIWYCGSKNYHIHKDGIIGSKESKNNRFCFNTSGCIWNMDCWNGKIIASTVSGEVVILNKETSQLSNILIPNTFALYDIQKISNSKYFFIGHGHTIKIVDFSTLKTTN